MKYLDKIESAAGKFGPIPPTVGPFTFLSANLLNFFSWSKKKNNEFFYLNKNYYITKLTQKRERKSMDRLAEPASIKHTYIHKIY